MTYWRRLECMTKTVCSNALTFYDGDFASISGFNELSSAHQKEVRDVFDECINGEAPKKKQATSGGGGGKSSKGAAVADDEGTADCCSPKEGSEGSESPLGAAPSKSAPKVCISTIALPWHSIIAPR